MSARARHLPEASRNRAGLHRRRPSAARRSRRRRALLLVLAVVGLGSGALGLRTSAEPASPGAEQRGVVTVAGSDARRAPTMAASAPVRLEVASVGVDTDLVDLGLAADGTLEVPAEPMAAGWYTGSPTPGQRGSSVIAGHVDSERTGPAVFHRLGQVAIGSRIAVTRRDGTVARFEVTAVRSYARADFPTRTVYGPADRATLRLVTCGDWNEETDQYDGNIVVYADLVDAGP